MKSSTRWLYIFGGIIGAILIASVVLVLTTTGEGTVKLYPADTPEGTVQRYLIAMNEGEFEDAYGYLSQEALVEQRGATSADEWMPKQVFAQTRSGWRATVGTAKITGSTAELTVSIDTYGPSSVLTDPLVSSNYIFRLSIEGSVWKITEPVYPLYFFY